MEVDKLKVEQRKNGTEKKKMEKVITGNAKIKKKSPTRKFTDVFISEDASNVKDYVLNEIIIPTMKKLFSDVIKDSVDMIFGINTRKSSNIRGDYVSYNRYSDQKNDRFSDNRFGPKKIYSPYDITLSNRGDAEYVLSQLDGAIETYGLVTVADLYELVGEKGTYMDNKYGWTNLRNAEAVRVRDGYMLKMPKALPID